MSHLLAFQRQCDATAVAVALMFITDIVVDQTMIKKIVGHSGAMTLTERVYTHLDIETLVEAINKI